MPIEERNRQILAIQEAAQNLSLAKEREVKQAEAQLKQILLQPNSPNKRSQFLTALAVLLEAKSAQKTLPLTNKEILQEITDFIININHSPEQKGFIAETLALLEEGPNLHDFKVLIETKISQIKGTEEEEGFLKNGNRLDSEEANEIIKSAYINAFAPFKEILQNVTSNRTFTGVQILPINNQSFQELASFLDSDYIREQMKSGIYQLILAIYDLQILPLWESCHLKFEAWVNTKQNRNFISFISLLSALTEKLTEICTTETGEQLGGDDLRRMMSGFYSYLKYKNAPTTISALNSDQKQLLSNFGGFIAFVSNPEAQKKFLRLNDIQSFWPKLDQYGTPKQLVTFTRNAFAVYFKFITTGLGSFTSNNFENFTGVKDAEFEPDSPPHKFSLKVLEGVLEPHKKEFDYGFQLLNEILLGEQEMAKMHGKPLLHNLGLSQHQPAMPERSPEDQAAFRYGLAKEKYTIHRKEEAYLLEIANRNSSSEIVKLIPSPKYEMVSKGIYSYASYIRALDLQIKAANDENKKLAKQWRNFWPFHHPTEHLKAARDFVKFMEYKRQNVVHPELRLDKNLHKYHPEATNPLTTNLFNRIETDKSRTFSANFKKIVTRLFSWLPRNKPVIELRNTFKKRVAELDAIKYEQTRAFPSKPVTKNLSTEQKRRWETEKYNRSVAVRTNLRRERSFLPLEEGFSEELQNQQTRENLSKSLSIYEKNNKLQRLLKPSGELMEATNLLNFIRKRIKSIIDEEAVQQCKKPQNEANLPDDVNTYITNIRKILDIPDLIPFIQTENKTVDLSLKELSDAIGCHATTAKELLEGVYFKQNELSQVMANLGSNHPEASTLETASKLYKKIQERAEILVGSEAFTQVQRAAPSMPITAVTPDEYDSTLDAFKPFTEMLKKPIFQTFLKSNQTGKTEGTNWTLDELKAILNLDDKTTATELYEAFDKENVRLNELKEKANLFLSTVYITDISHVGLVAYKEMCHGLYLRASIDVLNNSKLTEGNNLSSIGSLVKKMEAAGKDFKKHSKDYYYYLTAEIDSREYLQKLLAEIKNASDSFQSLSLQLTEWEKSFQEIIVNNISGMGNEHLELCKGKLLLIKSILSSINDTNLDKVIHDNDSALFEAKNDKVLATAKIKKITNVLKGTKYLAEHGTSLIEGKQSGPSR